MSKEKKVKVAVQMDKLNKINKDTDSTLALIQEAIKRRFSVFIYNVDNLYFENNELKAIVIDQVLDWSNEITNKIAPSIRAAMREKNLEKSKKLRREFIDNDLLLWFSYLEKLFDECSSKKNFFNGSKRRK